MTIEEKRKALNDYCNKVKCESCKLLGDVILKDGQRVGKTCLNVTFASEQDLDYALSLIGYKDTPTKKENTPTDRIRPLSPEQQKVCADVIKFYGYDTERMVAVEEMSELTKELSKQKRGKGDRAHIIEEMADVYICLEMLGQMNGITRDELYNWIDKKVERIAKKIESEGKITD